MGQGRNTVFLAIKSRDVTGFDIADERLTGAGANAEPAGAKINKVHQTNEAFDYGVDQSDLIVSVHEPFPVTPAACVERLAKSQKAGGLFVFESHVTEPSKPRPATAIDKPRQVLASFADFRLLYLGDRSRGPTGYYQGERRLWSVWSSRSCLRVCICGSPVRGG